jgi:arginase
MTRRLAVLDAPGHLGLTMHAGALDGGDDDYAYRLRELATRLSARDAGAVLVEHPCGPEAWANASRNGMQSFTEALAQRTQELVKAREFPIVLGGDCSILLGNMLALRRLGRYGLVFMDGRDEFSYASGKHRHCGYFASAGLDLALATGYGPDSLSNLSGLRPYVDERNVVLFGMVRDPVDAMLGGEPANDCWPQQFRVERIRSLGVRAAAEHALQYLKQQQLDGFWIHVDSDVLDRSSMPCSDSAESGGLDFEELSDALQVLLSSEGAAGLQLTIYDPELDPEGACGQRLVDSIVRAFTPSG